MIITQYDTIRKNISTKIDKKIRPRLSLYHFFYFGSVKLPINSTSYSTLGGWRTHERYYVVFNMLHGAVSWLPWDAQGLVPRYN